MVATALRWLLLLLGLADAALFNRYVPNQGTWSRVLQRPNNQVIKVDLLSSGGCNLEMLAIAAELIRENFHDDDDWTSSGKDSDAIGEGLEQRFGGWWMVAVFKAEQDIAYTIVRRTPVYMHFRVNERALLISKEAEHGGLFNARATN